MAQLSHPYMTTGKTIALTKRTFVGKVMSLLFNTLFRFVIAFLPRSKCPTIPCRPTGKGADGAPDGSLRGARPRDVQGCLMDSSLLFSVTVLASGGSVALTALPGALLWKEMRGGRVCPCSASPWRPLRRKMAVWTWGGRRGHVGVSTKDPRGPHGAETNTDPQAQQPEGNSAQMDAS